MKRPDIVFLLREARRRAGLSQAEAARRACIGDRSISAFETGRRIESLKVSQLFDLVDVYGLELEEFFAGAFIPKESDAVCPHCGRGVCVGCPIDESVEVSDGWAAEVVVGQPRRAGCVCYCHQGSVLASFCWPCCEAAQTAPAEAEVGTPVAVEASPVAESVAARVSSHQSAKCVGGCCVIPPEALDNGTREVAPLVLEVLERGPATIGDLAEELAFDRNTVWQALDRMTKQGRVRKIRRGVYAVAS